MRGQSGNFCGYWECGRRIPDDHFLCREHYEDWEDGLIDQCPRCGRFKDVMYDLCLDCYYERPVPRREPFNAIPPSKRYYNLEHSDAWEKGDRGADHFFVYILKLDGGKFYVGQTRELRERLSEHRDNKTVSTAGANPRLQYFEILPTREDAEHREAELKNILESNPRQIRRMIIGFRDLIHELNLE